MSLLPQYVPQTRFVSLFRREATGSLYVVAVADVDPIPGDCRVSAAVHHVTRSPYTADMFRTDAQALMRGMHASAKAHPRQRVYPVLVPVLAGLNRLREGEWERLDELHGLPELLGSYTPERGLELLAHDEAES
jgi:hypothetical protein